jgi:hypothetical protein
MEVTVQDLGFFTMALLKIRVFLGVVLCRWVDNSRFFEES